MRQLIFIFLLVGTMLAGGCAAWEDRVIPAFPDPGDLAPPDSLYYLALGDSYTIGESVPYAQRFPVQLQQLLNDSSGSPKTAAPQFVARTGWTTANLLAAMDTATFRTRYDLVSVLIGVNNQYQRQNLGLYEPHFRQIIGRALALAGNDAGRVIVLSIPDYAFTPFGQYSGRPEEISRQIDEYNAINRRVSAEFRIAYFDITPISRQGLVEPELVASDRLHPSGEQYRRWVERIWEGLN